MTFPSIKHKPTDCQLLNRCISSLAHPFDASDIDYLATHLSIAQLRAEIHCADLKYSISRTMEETPDEYWREYRDTCKLALKFRLLQSRIPHMGDGNHYSLDIQEVKRRTDTVDVISQFTTLKKSGKNFTGRCPLHDDHNPSLTVYPDNQRWWCFGCNRGGDIIDFIMEMEKVDFKQAITTLGGR